MARRERRERSPERKAVDEALTPFVAASAVGATVFMVLFGALFLVPMWLFGMLSWDGTGASWGLLLAAPLFVALVYAANRAGIRRQLGPFADLVAEVGIRAGGRRLELHGRAWKGWGVAFDLRVPGRGDLVSVVAARGRGPRPDLYLVRGQREYRFLAVRDPLPEVGEALRFVGLEDAPAADPAGAAPPAPPAGPAGTGS